MFKDFFVLYLTKNGSSYIKIFNLKEEGKLYSIIDFNEEICQISPATNYNYNSPSFRFHKDTPISFNKIYEYNFLRKELIVLEDIKLTGY